MRTITIRELRRGRPEEALRPGESVTIRKSGGKSFELRRLRAQPKSRTAALRALFKEFPNPGAHGPKVNLSGTFRDPS